MLAVATNAVATGRSHRWKLPVEGGKKMLTCKICGKKLKNKDALGGHMSGAHP
ncbi:hypothetical protein M1N92_00380 [Dehalococcoidia bacterium]|nr:hypothetical protein [Dehalococcoidia bacterium]